MVTDSSLSLYEQDFTKWFYSDLQQPLTTGQGIHICPYPTGLLPDDSL